MRADAGSTVTPDDGAQTFDEPIREQDLAGAVVNSAIGLTVIAHPDLCRVGEVATLFALTGGTAHLSRDAPHFAQPEGGPARPLGHRRVSRTPIVIRLKGDQLTVELDSHHKGVTISRQDAARTTWDDSALKDGIEVSFGEHIVLLLHHVSTVRAACGLAYRGESVAANLVRSEIRQVSQFIRANVLLVGDTGTGKGLVARVIHDSSARKRKPFEQVNLAAIPDTMAASSLFGIGVGVAGVDKPYEGCFARTDGGTLLLDELGLSSPVVQRHLLVALGDQQIQPVNGQPRSVAPCVIGATDVHLEAKVEAGEFSQALLQRFSYTIVLPPLHARRDDIARLFLDFLREHLREYGKENKLTRVDDSGRPWLPARVLRSLLWHPLPGNIRELQRLAQRLAVSNLNSETFVLPTGFIDVREPAAPAESPKRAGLLPTDEQFRLGWQQCAGDVSEMVKNLGVSRSWVYKQLGSNARNLSVETAVLAIESAGGDSSRAALGLAVLEVALRALVTGHSP
jgi:DNA-binding NtrC family response regulator